MALAYERITRGAFNQHQPGGSKCTHYTKRRSLAETLPEQIRSKALDLLSKAGVDPESSDWLWGNLKNWGSSLFGESNAAHAARKAASHIGSQLATRIALALPTTVAGPAGLVLGEAVESAVDYFMPDGSLTAKAPLLKDLAPKDWVAIDRGVHTLPNRPNEGTAFGETEVLVLKKRQTLFGETLDIGAAPEHDAPKRDLCLGFVVHSAARQAEWEVFCLTSGQVETVPIQDLRAPTPEQSRYLAGNLAAETLRDLFFVDAEPGTALSFPVRTDPGAEVITKVDGRVHYVVDAEGEDVLIEDQNGNRLHVGVKDLERGRALHDKAWNYVDGKVFATSFDDTTRDAVYRGRWVWLDPSPAAIEKLASCEVMLGVVNRVERVFVHAFAALDGEEFVVHLDDIRLVSPEDAASFAGNKPLVGFQAAVASDGRVTAHAVGSRSTTSLLLALGVMNGAVAPTATKLSAKTDSGRGPQDPTGEPGEIARVDQDAGRDVGVSEERPAAGDGGLRDMLDLAERAGGGGAIRDAVAQVYAKRLAGEEQFMEEATGELTRNSYNPWLLGAGALAVGYLALSL